MGFDLDDDENGHFCVVTAGLAAGTDCTDPVGREVVVDIQAVVDRIRFLVRDKEAVVVAGRIAVVARSMMMLKPVVVAAVAAAVADSTVDVAETVADGCSILTFYLGLKPVS